MTVENGKPEDKVTEPAAEHETVDEFVINEEGNIPMDGEVEQDAGNELLQQIEELTDQLGQAKDQTLRAHAEAQNIKRRAEQGR